MSIYQLSQSAKRRCFTHHLLAGGLLLAATCVHSMDFMQAYESARLNDASILAARANADAGRERLPQAKAQLLPNVSASVSRNRNNLESVSPNFLGEEQVSQRDYVSYNSTLSVRQPIYRPYQTAQLDQARAQVNDVDLGLAREEQNLVVKVGGAYFEALLAADQLALVSSQKSDSLVRLDAARKSFAAGSGTRTEVDEAQARLDLIVAQELEALQHVDFARRQMQTLVNKPFDDLAPLNVSKLNLSPLTPAGLQDWTERAERNSPEIGQLKAQIEVARYEVKKSQSGHLPTLDAVLQWTRSGSENVTQPSSRYTNTTIGVQLSIPLFAGGYVNSTVRQATFNVTRAEQVLEAARRDLGSRVHQEYRGVTESVAKIKALEKASLSADQLVLSSQKSLQAGSRTVIDVLNAQQQRMVVQRDLAQARYVYLISKIRLLALAGEADSQAVADINRVLQR